MSGVERIESGRSRGRPLLHIGASSLKLALVSAQTALILLASVVSGIAYHLAMHADTGPVASLAAVGGLTALLYILPFLSSGDYAVSAFLTGRSRLERLALRWHVALLLLATVGFLTKSTAIFSRGWIVLFYVAGFVGLAAFEAVAGRLVRQGIAKGHIAQRRLMLVGTSEDIDGFWSRRGDGANADRIVSFVRLPSAVGRSREAVRQASQEALEGAVEHARIFAVDAVLVLPRADDPELVARCLGVLSVLPVSIHLDAGPALDNVATTRIERMGRLAALTLSERPLTPLEAAAKRGLDILGALVGLLLLLPLLPAAALLIKFDSNGPVFFRQRRRGYNQREFRILKFRTMTTLDDGEVVAQARRDDPRITRVGAFLRRFNLDELPQLWNVLRGDMSIVGPRPHAVAHDRAFEKRIGRYGCRLNVKPGITGWAQIHGLRGETDGDEKMRARVEYDLYYIDHWSIWLDLYIILMTVVSRRAFANAR